MIRRGLLALPIRGSGPKRNRKVYPPVLHQSHKPEAPAITDFSSLGLKYAPTITPQFTIGWTTWNPPPAIAPDLPFLVERTGTGQSLPVYLDYKGGGTKVITIVRKLRGDIHDLKQDMEKVVGKEVKIGVGKLEVEGNFRRVLKVWLASLGF